MTIDLLTIPATEAERLAYAEGFTRTAELFARIADLELERDQLDDVVAGLQDELDKVTKKWHQAESEAVSLRADLAEYHWDER